MTLHGDDCITCGDVAVAARVVEVRGDTATVEADGRLEDVGVELVGLLRPGDLVLCHAGIALSRLEAEA